jgi:hypothetical protein
MKIYLAGTSVCSPVENKKMRNLFKFGHKMHSFYHCIEENGGLERRWFKVNIKNKVSLFIDSGAFSAWAQGVEIDIHEYIKFIKKYESLIDIYANLDVIGKGNDQSNEQAAKKTLENQKTMEAAGLHPMPVFHFGEPLGYLVYYIQNYKYVALGGSADKSGVRVIPWLDKCFSEYICDDKGIPTVKVHGFGMTSLHTMIRYPWYSVDSTSWVATSRFGAIYVPKYRNGQWIYDENSWKIAVSSRSPSTKEAGKHISTLSPKEREHILRYIHEKGYKLGKSRFEKVTQLHEVKENERWSERKPKDKTAKRLLEIIEEPGLCNEYQLRNELNIIYFQDLENALPNWPWPFKREGIQGFDL